MTVMREDCKHCYSKRVLCWWYGCQGCTGKYAPRKKKPAKREVE